MVSAWFDELAGWADEAWTTGTATVVTAFRIVLSEILQLPFQAAALILAIMFLG